MDNLENQSLEQSYKIGAVSRMTGVAQDTLRVWERRYGVVEPTRSEAGRRQYTQEDITRLTLIKQLLDQGDSIGSVANLTLDQLNQRVSHLYAPAAMDAEEIPCRLALLGTQQANKLVKGLADDARLTLLGLYHDKGAFLQEVPGLKADMIILEYSSLLEEHIKEIGQLLQRTGASRAMIVYSFASSETLARLESDRIIPLRTPVEMPEVRRLCHMRQEPQAASNLSRAAGVELTSEIPVRRFSNEELVQVADASVSVRCECPHHLVDIITSLSAFEHYSQQCEIQNVDDAALHAMLHAATAQARAIIEASLDRVIEIDGIEIDR
jgi:DNA-binding transcriptional MerR regulator